MASKAHLLDQIARLQAAIDDKKYEKDYGVHPPPRVFRGNGSSIRGARGGRGAAIAGRGRGSMRRGLSIRGRGRDTEYHPYRVEPYARGLVAPHHEVSAGSDRCSTPFAMRSCPSTLSSTDSSIQHQNQERYDRRIDQTEANLTRKRARPCARFTKTGICSYGLQCSFSHDPDHVALCQPFLRSKCTKKNCTLSHKPNAHNSPLCIHYQRGRCNNNSCKYTHMDVAANAKVCTEFALLGYCERGSRCNKRHVLECPDFERTGGCPRGKDCHLKHIYRVYHEPADNDKRDPTDGTRDSQHIDIDAITRGLTGEGDDSHNIILDDDGKEDRAEEKHVEESEDDESGQDQEEDNENLFMATDSDEEDHYIDNSDYISL